VINQDYSYRNPFTLLGLKPEDLGDLTELKRAKKRLLSEAGLSDDGIYTNGNITLNAYEIEQLFVELEQTEDLIFYAAISNCDDLDAFLSGNKVFSLRNILYDPIWQEKGDVKIKAVNLFTAQFSRRLKNAVIACRADQIKQLTSPDISNWGEFSTKLLYQPTMEYLNEKYTEINAACRIPNWLNYNPKTLNDHVNTHFSPEILNLLPDEFFEIRCKLAIELIQAAKKSYLLKKSFYDMAVSLALSFKLSPIGYAKVQSLIELIQKVPLTPKETPKTAPKVPPEAPKTILVPLTFWQKIQRRFKRLSYFYQVITILIIVRTFLGFIGLMIGNGGFLVNNNDNLTKTIESTPLVIDFDKFFSEKLPVNVRSLLEKTNLSGEKLSVGDAKNSPKEEWYKYIATMERLNCCFKYYIEETLLQPVMLKVRSTKNFVIYIKTFKNGKVTSVFGSTIKGCGIGVIALPDCDDAQMYVAIAESWDAKAKNPCNKLGFLDETATYRYVEHVVFTEKGEIPSLNYEKSLDLSKNLEESEESNKKIFFLNAIQ
jgi:hypothetical protein